MNNADELPGRVPFPAGDVTFGILAADKLPETIVLKLRDAAGAVGALRQQPLMIPLQLNHAAQGIRDAVRQRIAVIRVVVSGAVSTGIGFVLQPPPQIICRLQGGLVRINDAGQAVGLAVPVVGCGPFFRVGLLRQASVFIPYAAANGSAGKNDVSEFPVAVDKGGPASVKIRITGDVVIVINQPVRLCTIVPDDPASAALIVIIQRQLFAAAVPESHHTGQARNGLPAVLAQQTVDIFMGSHQAIVPAKPSAHATAPARHGDEPALSVISITDQADLIIQPGAVKTPALITAHHALTGAVGQGI